MDDDPLIILIIDTIFPNKKREEKKITKNMSLAVCTIRGWNRGELIGSTLRACTHRSARRAFIAM